MRFRVCFSVAPLVIVEWITWDRVGLLGGKWRPSVGKVGEWFVSSRHLQGCSPCLCRLRTDGLAPVSKYWMYRSHAGEPCSMLSPDVWLSPLLYWLARERNLVQTHRSVSRRAMDCVRSPFSQEKWLCPTLLMIHERLLYVDHVRYIWSKAIHGPSMESVWRVGRVFPCRYTLIRIAATLRYE
jgi:hypothetical protein